MVVHWQGRRWINNWLDLTRVECCDAGLVYLSVCLESSGPRNHCGSPSDSLYLVRSAGDLNLGIVNNKVVDIVISDYIGNQFLFLLALALAGRT